MTVGLEKTFSILSNTQNETSVRVLIDALDVSNRDVQSGALRALLARKSPFGQRELVRRWHELRQRWKKMVGESGSQLSSAIRDAIVSQDEQLHENGCDAILVTRDFDLLPTLITAAEDRSNSRADRSAETLLQLADALCEERDTPRNYQSRRTPEKNRTQAVVALQRSVERFDQHKRVEILEAFLMLASHQNSTLNHILQHPHDKAYVTLVHLLSSSPRLGVMRLILESVDDPRAPSAVYSILSRRQDISFVRHMLKRFADEVPASARRNLKRIESFSWLRDDMSMLTALNGEEQRGAVHMTMASGASRLHVFKVIEFVLTNGAVEGRRAAAAALSEFRGAEANAAVVTALQDEDSVVRATAVSQLRERGIRGAMNTLLELVDSPDQEVRDVAVEALSEFTFERFLAVFGTLDDETLAETAQFVRRVDPKMFDGLKQELRSPIRMRRIRAIQMAIAMNVITDVEPLVIELLGDEDHVIRSAAADALVHSPSVASRNALRDVILDRSQTVREAAEQTLQAFAHVDFDLTSQQPPVVPDLTFHDSSTGPLMMDSGEAAIK